MAGVNKHRWTLGVTGSVGLLLVISGLTATLYAQNVSTQTPPTGSLSDFARWAPIVVLLAATGFTFLCGLTRSPDLYHSLVFVEIIGTIAALAVLNVTLNLCGLPSVTLLNPGALPTPVNCTAGVSLMRSPCAVPAVALAGAAILLWTHILGIYAAHKIPSMIRASLGGSRA